MPFGFEISENKEYNQPLINPYNRFVEVIYKQTETGNITPIKIVWDEMNTFLIDKIIDVTNTASLKLGGVGIRYKCRILMRETNLFYDTIQKKWFVEAKNERGGRE